VQLEKERVVHYFWHYVVGEVCSFLGLFRLMLGR
jgi:hypothetical protein